MKIRVMSFNIRCCDDRDGHTVAERAPRILDVINEYDPDLIGVQEFTPVWEDHFKTICGERYGMLNKYRTAAGWIEGGPLLWKREKFILEDKGWFWYSDTPDVESGDWDELGHKRICTYVKLRCEEKEFVFMNTHFGFGDVCQQKSAELIKERAEKFGALPYFITGDFNAKPDSPAYRVMTSFMTDANTKDLQSITYHGYHPGSDGCSHIDYCFCGKGVEALDAEIIRKTFDGKFPSDHYPLLTVLEI